MSFDDIFGDDTEPPARPRDTKIDEAKAVLMEHFFPPDGENVYYSRQLEIALEDQFFHWITSRALNELAGQQQISSSREATGQFVAKFYWPRRYRYPRRKIRATLGLIEEFSLPTFTHALGDHGELLIDSGLANIGFRIRRRNAITANGRIWTRTEHNLDRIVSRDGIKYGVEIKNTLGYIDQTEFQIKLEMCDFLGVRPLFVARMMPRNYIEDVRAAGGFSLILKNQNYPLMMDDLATRVRNQLGLPVFVLRQLPDTTMQRFERWHESSLGRVNRP